MKDFILTLTIVFVFVFVFLFFGGAMLLEYFWFLVLAFSLLVSLLIHAFIKLSDKIEQLEKRIELLESEKKDA